MKKHELQTPAILLDLDKLEHNPILAGTLQRKRQTAVAHD